MTGRVTAAGPLMITENDPDAVGLPVEVPVADRRSTPWRLRAQAVVVVLLALAFGCAAVTGVTALRAGFREITQRAGPRLTLATEVTTVFGDLDARAAELQRTGAEIQRLGGRSAHEGRTAAWDAYERGRVRANERLYRLVAAVDGDARTQLSVRDLLRGFGRYQTLVAQASTLDALTNAAGTAEVAAARYREAAELMNGPLLVQVRMLAEQDRERVDRAVLEGRETARATAWAVLASGVALVWRLVALQVLLARRVRRWVSPWLMAATAAILVLLPFTLWLIDRKPPGTAVIPAVGMGVVAVCVHLGVRPRLAEYR